MIRETGQASYYDIRKADTRIWMDLNVICTRITLGFGKVMIVGLLDGIGCIFFIGLDVCT